VAISTVEPATLVGSITPNGVTRPVRPVLTSIVEELGVDLLGRVLERDRPPRRTAGRAEPALQADVVDLDHDAVDLVGDDRVPVLAVVIDVVLDLREDSSTLHLGRRSAGPTRQRGVGLRLRGRLEALARADAVADHRRAARVAVTRGSFCRSEPAAALRGLAKSGLPASAIDRVEPLERLGRQEHLAAHLDQRRHRELVGAGQPVRDRGDRLDVGRDVLARAPSPRVSARTSRPSRRAG
jgi:hypothetical protein